MTAVLHLRIEVNLIALSAPVGGTESHADIATLRAYAECFQMMAIAAMVVGPGIFLFRSGRVRQAVSAD